MSFSHLGSVTKTHRLKLKLRNGACTVCKTPEAAKGRERKKTTPNYALANPEGVKLISSKTAVKTGVKSKCINVKNVPFILSHPGLYRQVQVEMLLLSMAAVCCWSHTAL